MNHPAAFINEISENGTKEEAVKWLQSTWNDYMETSNKLAELTKQRDELADALRGLSHVYAHCWDLVNGDLLMMESSVHRLESAQEAAETALARIKD